jgi:N-acetyltransferase
MENEGLFSLTGERVRLEPLDRSHLGPLCEIGLESSIWQWALERISTSEAMQRYIDTALADRARGVAVPFVTRLLPDGKIVGSTRFGNIDRGNRRAEIGWTWLAPEWQRTFVNTEAKYLMLRHAFEEWGCIRVEFKTDALNRASRNAILRIGATEEGTFRKHMITDTGRYRDSVYFSILEGEWPIIRSRLEAMLKT